MQKGQQSAPFELLIAVILMSFVLYVGYMAIERVNFNNCIQENDKILSEFKFALEKAGLGKGAAQVDLTLPACVSTEEQTLRLEVEVDPLVCSNICSESRSTCVILRLANPKMPLITKCINIPPLTTFETGGGICQPIEKHKLENLFLDTGSIPEGKYRLESRTQTSGAPVICAYHCLPGENC